jgi:hypothetical protein
MGGCPQIVVSDNLCSAVTRPDRSEPDVNATYAEMAAHYGVAVIPARPYKPRDKPRAESGVLLAGRDSPEVTAALPDRLAVDNDASVRSAAARAFLMEPSPWALVIAARAVLTLPHSCWPTLAAVAGQLMLRHYLRLETADRVAVRIAISELSAAKAA